MLHLLGNLGVAAIMVVATVIIHFLGLMVLIRMLDHQGRRVDHWHKIARHSVLLVVAVLGIVLLHSMEIWAYAALYLALGVFSGLEPALYFSTVSFTSLGYGDIVLGPDWRILGAIEAANGLILFGWSTAFLLSMMGKLRALEHEWKIK